MYGGKIQEVAPVRRLFANPLHPYTQGLLGSIPRADGERAKRLTVDSRQRARAFSTCPPGCKFVDALPAPLRAVRGHEPPLVEVEPDHFVRCHLYPR